MPHFISPGQLRQVRQAVIRLSKVLDRFCDAYPTDGALRDELAVSPSRGRADPDRPRLPAADAHRRLDAFDRLRRQAPGVERRLAGGIGYTDILYEAAASIDLPRVERRVRHRLHADAAELIATLLDAYAHVRTKSPDLPASAAAGDRRLTGARPRYPNSRILRRPPAGADRGSDRTARRAAYDGTALLRARRAGPPRLRAARSTRTLDQSTPWPRPPATAGSAWSTRSARASRTTRR